MQQLAYGTWANFVNKYYKLGENTMIDCLKQLVQLSMTIFQPMYL